MPRWTDPIFEKFPVDTKAVVELGTFRGEWARRLLRARQGPYRIYCVDSWREEHVKKRAEFKRAFASEVRAGKIVMLHGTPPDVAARWRRNVDVLFIDADHAAVFEYLCAWCPYVRHAGLVIGHDFSGHQKSPLVQRALYRYFGIEVPYHTGPYVGCTASAAWRIHSFYFHKEGGIGLQDRRSLEFREPVSFPTFRNDEPPSVDEDLTSAVDLFISELDNRNPYTQEP